MVSTGFITIKENSQEEVAKKIAESVNKIRTDIGNNLIEKYDELLQYFKIYDCKYIAHTISILQKEGLLFKKQDGDKIGYAFSSPGTPIHYSLFKNIRSEKYAKKKEKQKEQNTLTSMAFISEKDTEELCNMAYKMLENCNEIVNIKAVELIKRCPDQDDRTATFNLYLIREYAAIFANSLLRILNKKN